MQEVVQLVGTVGFPIAVCCYVLFRLEKTMGELRDGIRELIVIHRGGGGAL